MAKSLVRQSTQTVRSALINIDNGAATTVDEALFKVGSHGGRLVRVYAIYQEAAGTVAGANYKLGASAGGADYVAATAYTDSAAVGDVTAGTIVLDRIPANGVVFLRHTGIAATAAGTVNVCVEWVENE